MTQEDVPWLDAEERETWLAIVGLFTRLPSALDAQLQRDAGLNGFEYHVLAMLSEQPGRKMRMSVLAQKVNGSISRLSHGLRRLERQDLVRREPAPEDGRSNNAVLTEEGLAKIRAIAPAHVRTVRHLVFDVLTATQQRHVREAGARILDRIEDTEF